jgi:hypothetical protein
MDDDEVVETSDSEEREAIRASYPDYWLRDTCPLSSSSSFAQRFLVPESGLDVLDNSQDELLLSTQPKSPTNGNRVQPSPLDSHRRESPSFADQPVPNVRSRSGSVDPLSLFSSMPAMPPFSGIHENNLPPDESVPCTPPISSNISSTTSVRDQTPSPPPQSFPNNHHPNPQDLRDAEVMRYSLRTRQPKQVKPYAYDRVAYKQQMKSNPDAIVKFQSLRRGSRGIKETDWAMDLENMDQDEIWEEGWGRKERSLDSVDDENNGGVGKWYPKSLCDNLSSDEDKEVRELRKEVKNARKKQETEEKTREDKDNRRRKQKFTVSTIHQSEGHTLRETPKTEDRRSRSTVCLIRHLHFLNQSCGYSGKHSLD